MGLASAAFIKYQNLSRSDPESRKGQEVLLLAPIEVSQKSVRLEEGVASVLPVAIAARGGLRRWPRAST